MVPLTTSRLVSFGLLSIVSILLWVFLIIGTEQCDCLEVSFLDVGQGDAIYIRTPDNKELLIDGGRDGTVLRALAQRRHFFDRTIDVIVATHPDVDHVGGLIDVLQRYQVEVVFLTEKENDTLAADAFTNAVENEGAVIIYPDAGQRFQLGASTTLTIFSPRGDERNWESNNASIVMKVSYGDTDILLTGDASTGIEEFLVATYGQLLESEILKLGHHGSQTSTSELFLDTVKPEVAIVSAGVDNRYNHPHQTVMERVFSRNITTFHTGVDGTVTFYSDGKNIIKK